MNNNIYRPSNLKHIIINNDIIPKIKSPAIFFDRDGVLIKDCHHIKDPEKVILLDGVTDLIKRANKNGWLIIIITNQSGISRGLFSWEDYEIVTNKMLKLIGKNLIVNAIYANGYCNNVNGVEEWRKPNPGMLFQAAIDLNIDLSKSILFGDRLSDLVAGKRAGLKEVFHLLTGHGKQDRINVIEAIEEPIKNTLMYDLKKTSNTKTVLIDNLSKFCLNKLS